MKISEVGKTREIKIPSGQTVCVTVDEDFDDAEGVIVTSGTPYELYGFLTSESDYVPTGKEPHSIRMHKGCETLFLEIGEKVDLWMSTRSNQTETVFVQEFK